MGMNENDIDVYKGGADQLVSADVLGKIPLLDSSCLIAGNEFPLVWVYDDVVHFTA